ncbi:DUF721 domain-containing protein [bacterium]|nr:DUF721 domain-containing protein [bacterium]
MSWINLNNLLSKLNSRPEIKNNFQAQIIKKTLSGFGVEDLSLQQKKLFIKTRNPVVAQELSFKKEEIKKEINKRFNEEVIKEIIIKRV